MKNTVQTFRALSDETRVRILGLLLNGGELCVCHLTATLQLPQSTVSRHLSYLKNAGWVTDRREGIWIYYRVTAQSALQQQMAELLRERLKELGPVAGDLGRLASVVKGTCCS